MTTTALPPAPRLHEFDAELIRLRGRPAPRLRVWQGPHRWLQIEEPPASPGSVELADLLRASAMIPEAASPPHQVTLLGTGVVARLLATALAEMPDRRITVSSCGRPPQRWQAQLCRDGVAEWSGDLPVDPGLVVVASETIEPDRLLLAELTRSGIEHVVARAHGSIAEVGPWVVPGRIACQGCLDRWLAAADRDYPTVLAELTCRLADPRPNLAAWAAGVLAGHAGRPGGGSRALNGRVDVFDELDPHLTCHTFGVHPDCPCGAYSASPLTPR